MEAPASTPAAGLSAGSSASKKKRNRARDRQRRKEKREQERIANELLSADASSDSTDHLASSSDDDDDPDEDEEDMDPNAIYGPRGEKKWEWDARVGAQPPADPSWSAFCKRAKARRGKPIEYSKTNYSVDQILDVDGDAPLTAKRLTTDATVRVNEIRFHTGVDVTDLEMDRLSLAGPAFRANVYSFVAGYSASGKDHKLPISITDAGVATLTKAFPNLKAITLHGAHKLGSEWFPTVLKQCPNITAITVCAVERSEHGTSLSGEYLNWLMDKSFVPGLRYVELRNVAYPQENRRFLDFLTKRRPQLEIVWVTTLEESFIRDAESVPLAVVQRHGDKEEDEDEDEDEDEAEDAIDDDGDEAWEDLDDHVNAPTMFGDLLSSGGFDSRISDDPKENARTLRKIGQQDAMRSMLGRDLYDFEMDSDYDDHDLDYDSDEELEPEDMRKMLAMMDLMREEMDEDEYR